ncbi:MAG: hypothetical protein ETSY1_28070 [Candidatus Entotheonella factor]|uniref:Uncharacterized protein n=1 Tax=Entotheonella factor TaxID=1429438 RepID=W4LED4_ENTF1|nr:MAG: hypothetical protein ETSY1_28070 [Candidatus Entotheonella factor]
MRKVHTMSRQMISIMLTVAVMVCVAALIVQADPKKGEQLIMEKIVELPDKKTNVKIRLVTFPVGYITPEHTHKGPGFFMFSREKCG